MKSVTKISLLVGAMILVIPSGFVFAEQTTILDMGSVLNKTDAELKLKIIFRRTLHRGSVGDDVTQLQHFLIQHNYLSSTTLPSDGHFGPLTEKGVKNYQQDNSLERVGIVGPRTRAIIIGKLLEEQALLVDEDTLQALGTSTDATSTILSITASSTPDLNDTEDQATADPLSDLSSSDPEVIDPTSDIVLPPDVSLVSPTVTAVPSIVPVSTSTTNKVTTPKHKEEPVLTKIHK